MKTRLLFASALVAAVSLPATAQDNTSSSELTLIGQVQAKCIVGDPAGNTDLSFGNPGASTSASFTGIALQCNSANGVTVSLTSRNGALQAGNVNGVPYTATLTSDDVGLALTLNANNNGNEARNSADIAGTQTLAAGTTASLQIDVPVTPSFSGLYTDDLVISLVSGG